MKHKHGEPPSRAKRNGGHGSAFTRAYTRWPLRSPYAGPGGRPSRSSCNCCTRVNAGNLWLAAMGSPTLGGCSRCRCAHFAGTFFRPSYRYQAAAVWMLREGKPDAQYEIGGRRRHCFGCIGPAWLGDEISLTVPLANTETVALRSC